MAESGEEKLLAMARHIAKTLGHNMADADNILQIFSNFDGRFSKEKLSDPLGCATLEQTLNSLHPIITRHVSSTKSIFSNPSDKAEFLAALDELIATVKHWNPLAEDETVGACLARANTILHQAMFLAENEFRSLMQLSAESTRNWLFNSDDDGEEETDGDGEEDSIRVTEPVSGYNAVIDALPAGIVDDLLRIAERMVAAGFKKECTRVYVDCRREFLEESVLRLGFRSLSISEIQNMPLEELEDEIARWIKASSVALGILFPCERRLCDRVFSAVAGDVSVAEVCRGSAIQLLRFADAVAIGDRSPERLFRVLDVFDAMRDLIPEFKSLFSDQHCAFLLNEAIAVLTRLEEAIKGMFVELENLIRRDPAKAVVPGGGLHPITRYVMNFLRSVCRSRQTLELVFHDDMVHELKDYPNLDDRINVQSNSNSSLYFQISWIMELLESNLEAKSKNYKDPALCSVFMMNNLRYIVQKARDSELGTLLGDDWIRKHTTKVRQCHLSYQRSSWNKVLGFLKVESNNGSIGSNVVAAKALKEKLKLFNLHFEEICRVQSQWFVFDEQLREEIRISLERIVLPAYGSFLGRFQNVLELGKHADKYVKYGVEDIGSRLNDLFQGSSDASNGGRK